ncbi:hypothetical protein C8J57DRAFT_1272188 [Mycena rebaudengoi]|nr:hypothetical protein C8J57DRAFT_1272188 [Mycena rebaudengoi]
MAFSTADTNVDPLHRYAMYPFSTDDEYQSGLASIIAGGALDNNPPEEIKEEILRRTRVFYFNSVTGNSITMDEAREYEQSHPSNIPRETLPLHQLPVSPSAEEQIPPQEPPVILSFAQLQELIEAGKADQIPNNKIIPEEINDAPPSTSTAPARKKPWETETAHST